jgi:hypothetical protein
MSDATGSKKVKVSNAPTPSIVPTEREEFTKRVLLSIANDVATLNESSDRITTQIRALALEYKIAG